MSVTVKKVETGKELAQYIEFPNKLYKDMPAFVPKFFFDEKETLSPETNPAFEFCDAESYLAYKDGKIAGRVTAIVNKKANEIWNHNEVRFGWLDFVDDREVSKALMDKVVEFGKARGMDKIVGPLGFTDLDPEGMLVDGYEELSTMALNHNWPYYKEHLEALGYVKEIDWLEYKVYIPEVLPEKYHRVSEMVKERYNLHIRRYRRWEIKKYDVGNRLFKLITDTYSQLYNYTPLTQGLIDKYVKFYLGVLDLRYLIIVEDENNEMVGFGVGMPSITRALKKCKGKLFPFGWFHILKAMYIKHEPNMELFLIGVREDLRKKGATALIFEAMFEMAAKHGFKYAETNAELEDNYSVRSQWEGLEYDQRKRRRVYQKGI